MREKAKELQRQRLEAGKRGYKATNSSGFSSSSAYTSPVVETVEIPKSTYNPP